MILICDDDAAVRQGLSLALRAESFEAQGCGPAEYAGLLDDRVEAVLLDINLGSVNGIELLKWTLERRPSLPVIMISGQATVRDAFASVKLGAYDFLEKPVSLERLSVCVRNALRDFHRTVESRMFFYPVAVSPVFRQALDRLARAARSGMPVLVTGESGTGKDAAAGYIHSLSDRAGKPLIRLNCGAIPESLIESELFGHMKGSFTGAISDYSGKLAAAAGGTVFLDEVGDLPLSAQTRLLRFLESGEIQRIGSTTVQRCDVRVVSATNVDLERAAAAGRFRKDLLYRLGVLPVHLPPLRERREDIIPLVEHFFRERGRSSRIDEILNPEAVKVLLDYSWPGNVRELRSLCERLVVWAERFPVTPRDLRPFLTGTDTVTDRDPFSITLPYQEAKRRLEWRYLQTQIALHGSVKAAAQALGLLPNNLTRRLRELERRESEDVPLPDI